LEFGDGYRRKKLIRAIESHRMHDRPTCSECSEKLQSRRGCKKPGFDYEQTGNPYVYSSPRLQDPEDRIMYECPTGYILREAPHVYDVLTACALVENASPVDLSMIPSYVLELAKVYGSEQARMMDNDHKQMQAKSDAAHGQAIVRSRRG
jgi:hypothetical protein